MYYTIKVDSNNIKLAANKLNAVGFNPIPVSLTGTGSGEQFVSKINPKVEAVTGNTVDVGLTTFTTIQRRGTGIRDTGALPKKT